MTPVLSLPFFTAKQK